MIKSWNVVQDIRDSARQLTNQLLKLTRATCAIVFLRECLAKKVVPRFVNDWCKNIPAPVISTKATRRKLESLKKELIRNSIRVQEDKLKELKRNIGFNYLKITRRCKEVESDEILKLLTKMVQIEEVTIYKRHCKKRRDWTGSDLGLFSVSYHVDYVPRFPFVHFDRFWLRRMDHTNSVNNNNKFTIDADISVPKDVCDVLEKGPKFRVPHKLNNQTISTAKMDLEVLTYKVRWQDKFKDDPSRQYFHIPFDKNTVKLPPKMTKD